MILKTGVWHVHHNTVLQFTAWPGSIYSCDAKRAGYAARFENFTVE